MNHVERNQAAIMVKEAMQKQAFKAQLAKSIGRKALQFGRNVWGGKARQAQALSKSMSNKYQKALASGNNAATYRNASIRANQLARNTQASTNRARKQLATGAGFIGGGGSLGLNRPNNQVAAPVGYPAGYPTYQSQWMYENTY